MKFDYKQGMQEREKLLIEQGKLLNQITETIKQPFQERYDGVDMHEQYVGGLQELKNLLKK